MKIADARPADDPDQAALRIAPRTMLCGTGWRVHEHVAGVLALDDSAVSEVEEALRVAERSSDDLAVGFVRATLGMALVHRQAPADRDRGQLLLAEVSDVFLRQGYMLSELPIIQVYLMREMVRRGDRDEAIPLMRAAVDHLFREGRLLGWGIPATGVLVETLLDSGSESGVDEAAAAIDRLAAMPAEEGLGDTGDLVAAITNSSSARSRRHGGPRRSPGSLPRHGDIAGLRGAYRLGRGNGR